jgi:choline monooxygenase
VATTRWPTTLPYTWYVEQGILQREQERLFGRFWQYVARLDQVAEPGQVATSSVGTLPIVLTRDREGVLRGFVNVCRHRGTILCDGDARRETLQCPYHAWTYDLDGSLRRAPRAEHEPGFAPAELGLVPVSVGVWGPFVFANPDPEAGPLADWLGEIPELVASAGVDVDALVFHARPEIAPYASNWKVNVENFLECYHCQIAHPTLAKAIDVTQDGYLLETRRWSSTQLARGRDGGNGVYDASGIVVEGQFHLLFPNTVINVMPGRANLSIGPVLPLEPERTRRFLDYFYGPEVDADWLEDFLVLDVEVGDEDRDLVERVQRGLRAGAGAIGAGVVLPASEKLIAHFQALVAEQLGD